MTLLPHPNKLWTKIITNERSNELDSYQPVKHAECHKGESNIEDFQTITTFIENVPSTAYPFDRYC